MVTHHEIKVADKTFKDIWSKRRNVKDYALDDSPLSTCNIVVIRKSDLKGTPIVRFDRLEILPTSAAVDGMTKIRTRVLDIYDRSVELEVTAICLVPKHPFIEPYEKVPEPEDLDLAAFKKLYTLFGELKNPFAVGRELGISRSTIYKYLNLDGTPAIGQQLLDELRQ